MALKPLLVLLLVACLRFESAAAFHGHRLTFALSQSLNQYSKLTMSFYSDFGEEDVEEDDEEEDEDDELDDSTLASFRSSMETMFGSTERAAQDTLNTPTDSTEEFNEIDELINFAIKKKQGCVDFAKPATQIEGGVILIANPAKFCTDFGNIAPSPTLLSKFGLTLPPPADLGPDRRADLLPVLCLLEKHPLRGSHAVLLNRRTGYLLGDLEQPAHEDGTPQTPKLGAFMIQPLWFGGTSAGGVEESSSQSSGLDMLHLCPTVDGAKKLTPDGLFWGGDPAQAQEAMSESTLDRVFTGFDFKFFVQSTKWMPLQLEKELRDGIWFVASVNKEVLFKPRDRMGTRRAKPLWTEIMELMGGEYLEAKQTLYADEQ